MSRPSLILAVFAIAIVGLSAWVLLRSQHSLPSDPLAAVPADAYGVVGLRVDRVLSSQAWKSLVVERGEARGIERATKVCGVNPLAGIDQLTVFARPGAGKDAMRVAFTARGKLNHAQLIDCARKLSGRSGLKLTHEDIEGIHTVRGEKGTSRLAFVARDGIVGGDADGVRDVLYTMLGKRASLAENRVLHDLYTELGEGSDLAAVAQSPAKLLSMLGSHSSVVDPSALGLDTAQALGARVALNPDSIHGRVIVVTDSAAHASDLARFVSAQRARVLEIPLIGLTGVSAPLRTAQIEATDRRMTLTASLKLRVAEALLDLLSL